MCDTITQTKIGAMMKNNIIIQMGREEIRNAREEFKCVRDDLRSVRDDLRSARNEIRKEFRNEMIARKNIMIQKCSNLKARLDNDNTTNERMGMACASNNNNNNNNLISKIKLKTQLGNDNERLKLLGTTNSNNGSNNSNNIISKIKVKAQLGNDTANNNERTTLLGTTSNDNNNSDTNSGIVMKRKKPREVIKEKWESMPRQPIRTAIKNKPIRTALKNKPVRTAIRNKIENHKNNKNNRDYNNRNGITTRTVDPIRAHIQNRIQQRQRQNQNNNNGNNNNGDNNIDLNSPRDVFLFGKDNDIRSLIENTGPTCCLQRIWVGNGNMGCVFPFVILVCRSGRTVFQTETLEAVYDANPGAIVADGTLHYACGMGQQASLSMIRFLVSKNPLALETTYQQRGLPLHMACATNAPIQIIEYLLSCYPDGIKHKAVFSVNNNKNNKNILKNSNNIIVHKIMTKQWNNNNNDNEKPANATIQSLPLHVAIEHNAHLETIKLLIKKYPLSVRVPNYTVERALEDKEGWQCLKGQNFHSAYVGNRGALPLSLACHSSSVVSVQTIRYLILQYPDALRTKNHSGWLPLHFACNAGVSLSVIQLLVTTCPPSVYQRTYDCRYPVEIVCSPANTKKEIDLSVLQYLISRHPVNSISKNSKAMLFRHYLFEADYNFADGNIIEFLRTVSDRAYMGYSYVSTSSLG